MPNLNNPTDPSSDLKIDEIVDEAVRNALRRYFGPGDIASRRTSLDLTVERLRWTDGNHELSSRLLNRRLLIEGPLHAHEIHASSIELGGENYRGRLTLRGMNGSERLVIDADGLGPWISTEDGRTTSYLAVKTEGDRDPSFALDRQGSLRVGGGGVDGVIKLRNGRGAVKTTLNAEKVRTPEISVDTLVANRFYNNRTFLGSTLVRFMKTDQAGLRTGDVVGFDRQSEKVVRCHHSRPTSVIGVVVDSPPQMIVLGQDDTTEGTVAVAVGGIARVRVTPFGPIDSEDETIGLPAVASSHEDGVAEIRAWRAVTPGTLLGKIVTAFSSRDDEVDVLLSLG